jgi:hypothetical protein
MVSVEEIARIKNGIVVLEQARDNSTDSELRKLIEAWMEEEQKKLKPSIPN